MKKILILLISVFTFLCLTACGNSNNSEPIKDNNETPQKENTEVNNEDNQDEIIEWDDEEMTEWDDEDNVPPEEEVVVVEKVINCDGCVFSYFSEVKKIGSTLSEEEYTTDINNIRTSGNKQRHNFFGLVLSGNTISKAYSCILKDNIIYCIQGSTNGAYHTNNIGVLNQIFTADQCKTLSDGNNYWCSDGNYNGNSKTSGYTALHYETSCTIYGADARTGELICH